MHFAVPYNPYDNFAKRWLTFCVIKAYNKIICKDAGVLVVNSFKNVFRVLALLCCLLSNLAIATTAIRTAEGEVTSRLVLVTSSPEMFNANGELIRKNEVFSLHTLNNVDISTIAKMQEKTAQNTLREICDTYIKNPLDATNELLYLLNCRKQKEDRILISRTSNGFRLSENYKVSPLKLFFIGSVSNDIDLNCTSLIERSDFVQNIIEDYTGNLMGKMPTQIVENYADSCLNLLTSEIEASMKQLGVISKIDMLFFWQAVLAYAGAVNQYMVSAYNAEVIVAYNLICDYISRALGCATYHEVVQLKNLMKLNTNIMDMQEKQDLSSSECQSLKTLFNKSGSGSNDDKELSPLNNVLSVMDKISIVDILNSFSLYEIENNMCSAMQNKMELLTDEIKKLVFCLSKLLLYKNN